MHEAIRTRKMSQSCFQHWIWTLIKSVSSGFISSILGNFEVKNEIHYDVHICINAYIYVMRYLKFEVNITFVWYGNEQKAKVKWQWPKSPFCRDIKMLWNGWVIWNSLAVNVDIRKPGNATIMSKSEVLFLEHRWWMERARIMTWLRCTRFSVHLCYMISQYQWYIGLYDQSAPVIYWVIWSVSASDILGCMISQRQWYIGLYDQSAPVIYWVVWSVSTSDILGCMISQRQWYIGLYDQSAPVIYWVVWSVSTSDILGCMISQHQWYIGLWYYTENSTRSSVIIRNDKRRSQRQTHDPAFCGPVPYS